MSIEIMSKAWKKSRQSGSRLLALLALADRADEDGVCWPGRDWIAERARVQPGKNIRRILRALEDAGEIVYDPGRGRGHRTYYLVAIALEPAEIKEIAKRRFQMSEEDAAAFVTDIINRQVQHQIDSSRNPLTQPAEKKEADTPPFSKKEGHSAPFSKKGAGKTPFSREKRANEPPSQNQKGGISAPEKGVIQSPKRGPYGPPDTSIDTSIDPLKKDLQQQQEIEIHDRTRAHARKGHAVAAEKGFSLEDAFRLAGIKAPTARRIPGAWQQATGQTLRPEDVLAWHFQREAENLGRTPERHLGVGAIIRYLEEGEPADDPYYDQAREFLLDQDIARNADAVITPSLDHAELIQALSAYLPTLEQSDMEELDQARARLLAIAQNLANIGVKADEIADLRLYLTYAGRPLPPPEKIAEVWQCAEPEFHTWRRRKREAERLWRFIADRLSSGLSGSAFHQLLQRATPLDLNGALVIRADPELEVYFRRVWPRQGTAILAHTDNPDIPIHFITR